MSASVYAPDEPVRVFWNRYDEARHAGLEHLKALEFAGSGRDIGELRRLVALGATPEQIAAIVI